MKELKSTDLTGHPEIDQYLVAGKISLENPDFLDTLEAHLSKEQIKDFLDKHVEDIQNPEFQAKYNHMTYAMFNKISLELPIMSKYSDRYQYAASNIATYSEALIANNLYIDELLELQEKYDNEILGKILISYDKGTDFLYKSKHMVVRSLYIHQGYAEEELAYDESDAVRLTLASYGHYFDILINDPSPQVRREVKRQLKEQEKYEELRKYIPDGE